MGSRLWRICPQPATPSQEVDVQEFFPWLPVGDIEYLRS
jgi:hypothetical protein